MKGRGFITLDETPVNSKGGKIYHLRASPSVQLQRNGSSSPDQRDRRHSKVKAIRHRDLRIEAVSQVFCGSNTRDYSMLSQEPALAY